MALDHLTMLEIFSRAGIGRKETIGEEAGSRAVSFCSNQAKPILPIETDNHIVHAIAAYVINVYRRSTRSSSSPAPGRLCMILPKLLATCPQSVAPLIHPREFRMELVSDANKYRLRISACWFYF